MRTPITLLALSMITSSIVGFRFTNHDTSRVKGNDGRLYRVRNDVPDPKESAAVLAELRRRINIFLTYLTPQTNPYHRRLVDRIHQTVIRENPLRHPPQNMTSYSINKGEEIILCLRNPQTQQLHDLDTLMYVMLHEVAHVACPEIGHTQLFVDIFADFLSIAVKKAKILQKTDFKSEPMRYCGITIAEKLV